MMSLVALLGAHALWLRPVPTCELGSEHACSALAPTAARPVPPRLHSTVAMSALRGLQLDVRAPSFKVGDTVRVKKSCKLKHLPKQVTDGAAVYDALGSVGAVVKAYDQPNLSPNLPIKVRRSPIALAALLSVVFHM